MRKPLGLGLVLVFSLVACGGAESIDDEVAPDRLTAHQLRSDSDSDSDSASAFAGTKSGDTVQKPLVDHGGTVIPGMHFYLIMWGTGFSTSTQSLYQSFLGGLGGSPYFSTNTQYLRGAKNTASYVATYADTASQPPATTTDANLRTEISAVIAKGGLPYDAKGLYFVVTPKKSKVCFGTSCSCSQFCGYHSSFTDPKRGAIFYSSIPSAAACPTSCGIFATDASSPNRNVEADEGVSVIAHEAEETQSDAYGNAWFDAQGFENGDKCAYKYGTTTLSAGAPVNQTWGGKSWLIQQNWSNAASACVAKP